MLCEGKMVTGEGLFMNNQESVNFYPKQDGMRNQHKPNFALEWRNYTGYMKEEVKKELSEFKSALEEEEKSIDKVEEQDWLMINLLNLK